VIGSSLDQISKEATKLMVEVSRFLQFHLLRLYEVDSKQFDEIMIDQNLIYRIMSILTSPNGQLRNYKLKHPKKKRSNNNNNKNDNNDSEMEISEDSDSELTLRSFEEKEKTKDKARSDLNGSFEKCKNLRPEEWKQFDFKGLRLILNELAKEYMTTLSNHLIYNFERRL